MPIYRETLDDPVGVVHVKDVFRLLAAADQAARRNRCRAAQDPARGALCARLDAAADLLLRMRTSRIHLALVIDEFGGTDGLVTMEDLIEAVVGEIDDEHDDATVAGIVARPGGVFEADARAPLEELEAALGQDLAPPDMEEDIDTVAGLVVALAGRVPQRGEVIAHPAATTWKWSRPIRAGCAGCACVPPPRAAEAAPRELQGPDALARTRPGAAGRPRRRPGPSAVRRAAGPAGLRPAAVAAGHAIERPRPLRSAFLRGWLAGLAYFGLGTWWIAEAFMVDAANQGWMAPFAVAAMAGGLALFWGWRRCSIA
jgi:hypothetical protein